jgi:hypothetical protein
VPLSPNTKQPHETKVRREAMGCDAPVGWNEPPTAEDTAAGEETVRIYRARQALHRVLAVHAPRTFDGDGYGWTICVEDRQAWPCVTVRAVGVDAEVAAPTRSDAVRESPPVPFPSETNLAEYEAATRDPEAPR